MDGVIRITTRLDNLYKYDVEVNCQKLDSFYLSESTNFVQDRYAIDVENGVSCYLKGGYSIELLLEISRYLGISLQLMSNISLYEFDYRNLGQTQPEVDLYVASYVLKASRRKVLDPTYVTGHSKLKAFLNHEFESSESDSLFMPVKPAVWLIMLVAALASLFSLQMLHSLAKTQVASRLSVFYLDPHLIFEGISIMLQKESQMLRHGADSIKIATISISLCFFTYYVAYSGWITAISSVNDRLITSVTSLVSSNYKILIDKGYGNGSASDLILRRMRLQDSEVNQLLLKAANLAVKFDTFENAIDQVRRGQVAFITEDDSGRAAIRSAIGEIPCTWGQIDVKRIRYPWSMFMRKGFKYRKQINVLLLKMDEIGLMRIIRRRSMPPVPNGVCTKLQDSVHLKDILSGFYPIIVGAVLAVIILIAERILIN